tara:strand:- start:1183 stop:1920 length:738 start_codon:yes stop_codon:yes gene_type:complete
MRIFASLIKRWEGDILINDKSIKDSNYYINKFGFMIEEPAFYEFLSAYQNLKLFARISNVSNKRIHECLELVNLSSRSTSKVKEYSYGMKQRLGLAQSILHDPDVLILDEPNNGLDPSGINEMTSIIQGLNSQGKTICISTHILSEVENLCTDLIILKKGKVIFNDTINNVYSKNSYFIDVSNITTAISILENIEDIDILSTSGNRIRIKSKTIKIIDLLTLLSDNKLKIYSFGKVSDLYSYFND